MAGKAMIGGDTKKGNRMNTHGSYIGFGELPDKDELFEALINDPPEIRWRIVRTLLRIEDPDQLAAVQGYFMNRLKAIKAPPAPAVVSRIQMTMNAIQRPVRVRGYIVVKGKGAYTTEEWEKAGYDIAKLDAVAEAREYDPAVEFHVHPKMPDLKFLSDFKKAGLSHAVILATDTDPADVDRPEIREMLRSRYDRSAHSRQVPFEQYLNFIRSNLFSNTHVTDEDVADWMTDYPETILGFGSVNLSKSPDYVTRKLAHIEKLNLRGIKLLPYSQFFNPMENENMDLLFQYCRRTGSVILSHTGCAAGPFELEELSRDCRPELWVDMARKYPDVPVVLAHFGSYSSQQPGIWFHNAVETMQQCKNVYVDISAAHYLFDDEENIETIRKKAGFGQVLFATDYPGPLHYGQTLEGLAKKLKANLWLSDEEKAAIFGGNAKSILGLDGR
jgi:predicted TIM-barrel fold metal-dependent hydrolase